MLYINLSCSIFINRIVNFIGIGLALYALAIVYQIISSDSIIDEIVECKYCQKNISQEVSILFAIVL